MKADLFDDWLKPVYPSGEITRYHPGSLADIMNEGFCIRLKEVPVDQCLLMKKQSCQVLASEITAST